MDPYRYLSFVSRQVMQAWAEREEPPAVAAWTPVRKPLASCRVALLSTAGISLRSDVPFDQDGERADPWWGDPSWRALPCDVTEDDVTIGHLHIDRTAIERDLDVALPIRRLRELVDDGVVGSASPTHLSIMGYTLDASELVGTTAPELASRVHDDRVDVLLLVPV